MKNLVFIIALIFCSLIKSYSQAQVNNFKGIATYKTKRQVDSKIADAIGEKYREQILEGLKKNLEKTYELSFNSTQSIYREQDKLEKPNIKNPSVKFIGVTSKTILYKDTREGRFVRQQDLLGKLFLIQDKLEQKNWELSTESKFIGEYECYKATRKIKRKKGGISIVIGNNDTNKKKDLEYEEALITVWYTPQIPISTGPKMFYGLPGLILEVNDGIETIICSKIVLNPKKDVKIQEPSKGKVVSEIEFNEIKEAKNKESLDNYSPKESGMIFKNN